VLVDPLDRQLGLLVVRQMRRDLFFDMSLTFIIIHDSDVGRGKVDALEGGCWLGGGGSVVLP
jgi:hypothetical protein